MNQVRQINQVHQQLPKTGDGVNKSLYAYAMALLGSALVALGLKKNKKSVDEE